MDFLYFPEELNKDVNNFVLTGFTHFLDSANTHYNSNFDQSLLAINGRSNKRLVLFKLFSDFDMLTYNYLKYVYRQGQ